MALKPPSSVVRVWMRYSWVPHTGRTWERIFWDIGLGRGWYWQIFPQIIYSQILVCASKIAGGLKKPH